MGLGISKTILLALILSLICILVALMVFGPFVTDAIIDVKGPRKGPLARFIRYMGCAAAMCSNGCGSDVVVRHALEYEGEKVVKSCNQLIEENGWCEGESPGTLRCGSDYAIEYTFESEVTYRDNYYVDRMDVSTYGTCGFGDSGWQSDATCVGDWENSDFFEPSCERCKLSEAIYGVAAPYGVLLSYEDGSTCGTRGGEMVGIDYNDFAGGIWVSENFADGNAYGSCGFDGRVSQTLGSCTFNEGNTFWIWAVENTQNVWIVEFEAPFFGTQRWQIVCGGPEVFQCPKIVVCDSEP